MIPWRTRIQKNVFDLYIIQIGVLTRNQANAARRVRRLKTPLLRCFGIVEVVWVRNSSALRLRVSIDEKVLFPLYARDGLKDLRAECRPL